MSEPRNHYHDPLPAEAAMRLKLSAHQLRLVADFLNEEIIIWSKEQPGSYVEANERIGDIAYRLKSLANAATSSEQRELCDQSQPFGTGWMASEAEMRALRRWMHQLTLADFERHTEDIEDAKRAHAGMEQLRIGFDNFDLEPGDQKSLYEQDLNP